jgi:hypothetical protein
MKKILLSLFFFFSIIVSKNLLFCETESLESNEFYESDTTQTRLDSDLLQETLEQKHKTYNFEVAIKEFKSPEDDAQKFYKEVSCFSQTYKNFMCSLVEFILNFYKEMNYEQMVKENFKNGDEIGESFNKKMSSFFAPSILTKLRKEISEKEYAYIFLFMQHDMEFLTDVYHNLPFGSTPYDDLKVKAELSKRDIQTYKFEVRFLKKFYELFYNDLQDKTILFGPEKGKELKKPSDSE